MRAVISVVLIAIGFISMFGVWLFTTFVFFATGQTGLALISLVIPPSDLVLPFLISWQLGAIGIGGMVVAIAGFALQKD